jgi:hypothetical protein
MSPSSPRATPRSPLRYDKKFWEKWILGVQLPAHLIDSTQEPRGLFTPNAGAAGGRNEETSSKYAEGIRKKRYPSRRQQQQIFGVGIIRHTKRQNSGWLSLVSSLANQSV